MANEILIQDAAGSSLSDIVWAHAADWPEGGAHGFGDDNYELDLTAVASTKAEQGAKGDLTATRAESYTVTVGLEWNTAPSAGDAVEIYWSASNSGTAGTGNTGGASGATGAYKDSEEDEWKKQLQLIGVFIATNDGNGTTQIQVVSNHFVPPLRYGMPVVVNESDQTFNSAGNADNMFVALSPNVPEIQ